MQFTSSENWLLREMEGLPVIDAHSHLPIERVRLAEHFDALTFYRQYTRLVMFAAGLQEPDFLRMHDPQTPLGERFDIFERYYPLIRFSSAARAAAISLHRFYGEESVTRDNFASITAQMQSLYRPGVLYRTALVDTCNVRAVLQNAPPGETDFADPLLRPVPMIGIGGEWNDYNDLARGLLAGEVPFVSVDDYLEDRKQRLRRLKSEGAVAFKHFAHPYCEPCAGDAQRTWEDLRQGKPTAARSATPNPLQSYLSDELFAEVARLNVPVAVHTGVWDDFREFDPQHLITYLRRHLDLRFDLFHMGIPNVRAMGRIAANNRNVWVNMCWAPTLSPTMAANALDEWIDMVPVNKLIGFGSDTRWPVEKVYGHLTLARETIAVVLGRRIDRGLLSHRDALELAAQWLFDNAAELYRLQAPSLKPLPANMGSVAVALMPKSADRDRQASTIS